MMTRIQCPKCNGLQECTTCMGIECLGCGFVKQPLSLRSLSTQLQQIRERDGYSSDKPPPKKRLTKRIKDGNERK